MRSFYRSIRHVLPLSVLVILALALLPGRATVAIPAGPLLSATNKIVLTTPAVAVAAPSTATFVWPFASGAILFDFVCVQVTAGTTGTYVQYDIQKNGTTMLATLGKTVIASGAGAKLDMAKKLTLLANDVRPVSKPVGAAIRVAKGDLVTIITTESGSYSPHPTTTCTAVFLPDL